MQFIYSKSGKEIMNEMMNSSDLDIIQEFGKKDKTRELILKKLTELMKGINKKYSLGKIHSDNVNKKFIKNKSDRISFYFEKPMSALQGIGAGMSFDPKKAQEKFEKKQYTKIAGFSGLIERDCKDIKETINNEFEEKIKDVLVERIPELNRIIVNIVF